MIQFGRLLPGPVSFHSLTDYEAVHLRPGRALDSIVLSSQSYPCPLYEQGYKRHVFAIPSPGYDILFKLSINLQHSLESLREENQERPPHPSPRISASDLRLPCIHPHHTSSPSRRSRSISKKRQEIDEMAQPYS